LSVALLAAAAAAASKFSRLNSVNPRTYMKKAG
jgi:hypothetical protein